MSAGLQLPTWAYSFGLGMAGAWAWVRITEPGSRAWLSRAPIVAAASAITLLALAWVIGGSLDQTRDSLLLSLLLSTALAVFMVSLSLCPSNGQRPFNLPVIRRLGDISYGVYLSHMVIALTLQSQFSMPDDGRPGAFLVWFLAVIPASILYGYLSARFVEQPIRRWARRRNAPDRAG
jgi:peptidoglycan/LPS O-acetylase OafA/YrhL